MHEDVQNKKPGWIENRADFSDYELRDIYEQYVREFQEWDKELTQQRTYDASGQSQY